MSGHSKWASIKHKKGAADAKRGQLFSKLSRAIIVAAEEGGPDPSANLALAERHREGARRTRCRRTTSSARSSAARAPTPTSEAFEAIVYEGYGPGGVAVIVEALTDNRNRTAADVRHAFSKNGGSLGDARLGRVAVRAQGRRARRRRGRRRGRADARRRRRRRRGRRARRRAGRSPPTPDDLHAVRAALEQAGHRDRVGRASTMLPKTHVEVERRGGAKCCASWTRSRRTTTSRTSTPTSTSRRACWKPSPANGGRALPAAPGSQL